MSIAGGIAAGLAVGIVVVGLAILAVFWLGGPSPERRLIDLYEEKEEWKRHPGAARALLDSEDPGWRWAREERDWRNYVGLRVRRLWPTFTDGQRRALIRDYQDLADRVGRTRVTDREVRDPQHPARGWRK